MTDALSLQIDDVRVWRAFAALAASCADLTPAMRKIAGTLERVTERNFEAQGRPRWAPLADATVRARIGRTRQSASDLRTLQDTGLLAASVNSSYDRVMAAIGSNRAYARIQQMGGHAGRGGRAYIPSRPYMPFSAEGVLQPEASAQVLASVMRHLRSAAGV